MTASLCENAEFDLGERLLAEGKAAEAEVVLLRAKLQEPSARVCLLLGKAQEALNKHEEATENYQEVLRKDPANAYANMHRHATLAAQAGAEYREGVRLLDAGEAGKAIGLFVRALAFGDHTDVLTHLGVALARCGHFTEAEGALRRALRVDPNNGKAFLELGRVLISQERGEEALMVLLNADSKSPAEEVSLRDAVVACFQLLARRERDSGLAGLNGILRNLTADQSIVLARLSNGIGTLLHRTDQLLRCIPRPGTHNEQRDTARAILPEVLQSLPGPAAEITLQQPALDGGKPFVQHMILLAWVRHWQPGHLLYFGAPGPLADEIAANLPQRARLSTLHLSPTETAADASSPEARTAELQRFVTANGKPEMVIFNADLGYLEALNLALEAGTMLPSGAGRMLWWHYGDWSGTTAALNHLYVTEAAFVRLKRVLGTSLALCL